MYGWENNGIFISRIYIKNKAGSISPIVQTRLPAREKIRYFFTCVVTAFLRAGNPCITPPFMWEIYIYIVCRNDYQQSKNWLCHILSSHLFETLFFYSYFITILLKNIISWLTNYKITPGSLTCDTLTERCPGFFTCETFFVFFAWIIFAGALKFVMRNIYIFKLQ